MAFLTMSLAIQCIGRSYWDLLSSEPQVWWKARPALLWGLLLKRCTELSQWDSTEWVRIRMLLIGSLRKTCFFFLFFFRFLKRRFFFIKDFHCAVPWPLPVLALLEEQLFAAWASVVEVQNDERNRGWEVHLFLVGVLAGACTEMIWKGCVFLKWPWNDNIYKWQTHSENKKV